MSKTILGILVFSLLAVQNVYFGYSQSIVVTPSDDISQVINSAKPGDTLLMQSGLYIGEILIAVEGDPDRPIVVMSASSDFNSFAVIDGGALSPGLNQSHNWIKFENSSWIEFINIQFQNGWTDPIRIENSSYISFKNCFFTGGRRVIRARGDRTHHVLVENCFWDQGGSYQWNIRSWSDGDAWDSMHHGELNFFNGTLFACEGTSGNHIIRGNTIQNAFNALRWNAEQGKDENIEIYENRISYVRDNDFEPEKYANNLFIHHNFSHNIHKTLSIDNVNGGNIYYFGNVITTDNASWTGSIATGFYKIYGEENNVTEPVYIFNNSFYGTGKVHGSIGDRKIQNVFHYNNAFDLTRRKWELDQWDESLVYDYDCSNEPFSQILTENAQEVHGLVASPGYLDPLNGDLRLKADSPCKNSGKIISIPRLDWTQTNFQSAPDIGAYEEDDQVVGPFFRTILPDASPPFEERPRITLVADHGETFTVSFSHPVDTTTVSGNLLGKDESGSMIILDQFESIDNGHSLRFAKGAIDFPVSVQVGPGLNGVNQQAATNWGNASNFKFLSKDEVASVLLMPLQGGKITINKERRILEKGSTVQLAAIPDDGYVFVGWEGDVEGNSTELEIVLDQSIWAIAHFEQEKKSITSIQNQVDKISFYPNPSDGLLTIGGKARILNVELYNSLGQMIFHQSDPITNIIDLSKLNPGPYLIHIESESGSVISRVLLF